MICDGPMARRRAGRSTSPDPVLGFTGRRAAPSVDAGSAGHQLLAHEPMASTRTML